MRWGTLFAVLGIVAGLVVAGRWARISGRGVAHPLLGFVVLAGAIAVGRLAVLIERPDVLRRGVGSAFLLTQGGLSVPAAAAGGLAVILAWAALRRQSPVPTLDVAAPALLVGEAIGAIGLLVNGDLATAPFDSPIALVYGRPDSAVPATLINRPMLPLALLGLVGVALAFLAIWLAWPQSRRGDPWLFAALAFGLEHLLIGYSRLEQPWLLGLKQDQLIGLAFVVLACVLLIFGRRMVRSPA